MSGTAPESDKDARIRILEFQADFLRRETEYITRRHQEIVYSAAWTLAKPIKRLEDFLHRLFDNARKPTPIARDVQTQNDLPPIPIGASEDEMAKVVAARIAARMMTART